MRIDYPRKLNFQEYEHSFSYDLLKDFEEGRLDGFDIETMRGLIYGYTFTEDYAKGVIPETFSMEYWAEKKDVPNREKYEHLVFLPFCKCAQEQLICDAINSTGEGISKENPFYPKYASLTIHSTMVTVFIPLLPMTRPWLGLSGEWKSKNPTKDS